MGLCVPLVVWRYVCVPLTMHSFCSCLSSMCFLWRPFPRPSVCRHLCPLILVSLALSHSPYSSDYLSVTITPNCWSLKTLTHTWVVSLIRMTLWVIFYDLAFFVSVYLLILLCFIIPFPSLFIARCLRAKDLSHDINQKSLIVSVRNINSLPHSLVWGREFNSMTKKLRQNAPKYSNGAHFTQMVKCVDNSTADFLGSAL